MNETLKLQNKLLCMVKKTKNTSGGVCVCVRKKEKKRKIKKKAMERQSHEIKQKPKEAKFP